MDTQYIITEGTYKNNTKSKLNRKKINLYTILKRSLDIILAIFISILLMPLIIVISILIKLDSKGPIIFKQKRAGLDSNEFYIYKFRTMNYGCPDVPTSELKESGCEITKIGRLIRKTSIDEIPQLYNIIKGEMSFVGPRPVIITENNLISLRKDRGIDKILPGITGWAQINGRDEISVDKKVDYDYEYLKKQSLKFDIYIMFMTVIKVLKAEGIREGE